MSYYTFSGSNVVLKHYPGYFLNLKHLIASKSLKTFLKANLFFFIFAIKDLK
jgi:hypothetical protein